MLSDHIFDDEACRRLQQTFPNSELDGYTDWLKDRRYTARTIHSYIYATARFLVWAQAQGCNQLSSLSGVILDSYRDHLRAELHTLKRVRDSSNSLCGAHRFILFLTHSGKIAPDKPPELSPLEEGFCAWLRRHRGVRPRTEAGYAYTMRRLEEALGSEPRSYTAAQLRAFVLTQSRGYGASHADHVVSTVRLFVRFLILHQQCPEGLQYAIPRAARWQQATLPRYLDSVDVQRVIDACDPSTPLGARDRAVLLLLARLGLRAGEVSGLRLGDIDWISARLRVSGKTHGQVWLPLPQDAGEAILHYLNSVRPTVDNDGVFLISRAPFTPIITRQVSSTAERAIRLAGVKAPSRGAHLFRHSAATAWLRQGMSLQAIGALLRHQQLDTTAIYAKVDIDSLRRIALPWPKEDGLC